MDSSCKGGGETVVLYRHKVDRYKRKRSGWHGIQERSVYRQAGMGNTYIVR